MVSKATIFFWIILIGAVYHLIRDVLQIAGIENVFTEIGHWSHGWCGKYCNHVALPIELFMIVASVIVIKRKRFGALGTGILVALLIGLSMWLWK